MRKPKPDIVETVVAHFDYLPASQVRNVLARYELERYRQELAKNPRIVTLAGLKVGHGTAPWPWGVPDRRERARPGVVYLQTQDKTRARALLDDPDAEWALTRDTRGVRVRRTR